MKIKDFAHTAQHRLESLTSSTFKRAHIYELLAAAFGYKSYAALCATAILLPRRPEDVPDGGFGVLQRCSELGYSPATSSAVSKQFPLLLADCEVDVVALIDLVARLRGESLDWDDDDQPGDLELIAALEAVTGKGTAVAQYALALLNDPGDDDENQQVGSSYWHDQEKAGAVLDGVHKEWADAHSKRLVRAERYLNHLRAAARLGNADALLDMADQFNDPSFFERDSGVVDADPLWVAEIAERLGRRQDAVNWLTVAARAGSIEAMRQLIEEYEHEGMQHCWTWFYLAQLLGTDLSKDQHYAINEDGSEYDDDVGGPAFVGGEDGLTLPNLDAEKDLIARNAAKELFARLQSV
jgi:TPR repeat protein